MDDIDEIEQEILQIESYLDDVREALLHAHFGALLNDTSLVFYAQLQGEYSRLSMTLSALFIELRILYAAYVRDVEAVFEDV